MAEPTFDVLFTGELFGAAESEFVKQRLARTFKLDESGVARLFSGQKVFIKRAVDRATAERYRAVFHAAGAVAQIVQVNQDPDALFRFDDSEPPDDAPGAPPTAGRPVEPGETLSLAPPGATLEELSERGPEQHPDTSKLSLVDGDDWSLEDCAPPPLAEPIPDIDTLALEPQSRSPEQLRDA